MSVLLRCATANGLSLHVLRGLAGIASMRTIWADDAQSFAALIGLPTQDLRALLIGRGKCLGEPAYLMNHHVFLRKELLRTTKPQVCVYCVHRTGFCKAMWDFRLYTVCHLHKKPLTDHCKSCRNPLRWYRSAVDVCQCGMYLQPSDESDVDDASSEMVVAQRLASAFGAENDISQAASNLPSWFDSLSLNGVGTLILAFGVRMRAHQTVEATALMTKSVEYWRDTCARAWQRLASFARGVDPAELAPWVWEGGLERMTQVAVSGADQQVALLLQSKLFGTKPSIKLGPRRLNPSQMSLFED